MANINGTNGNDQLFGTSEADVIFAASGNDLLVGDAGDDNLNGDAGVDTMRGGSGNDFYHVENSRDAVIENANDGTDTVLSVVNITLAANVENLLLSGNATVGTGNELNNVIQLQIPPDVILGSGTSFSLSGLGGNDTLIGGVGNDTLDGGVGNDTMSGGGGNDTYIVDSVGDVIQEALNGGIDTVNSTIDHTLSANVENLTLVNGFQEFDVPTALNGTGNDLNNSIVVTGDKFNNSLLRGLAGDDTLVSSFGNDTLEGGEGNDNLVGLLGNDTLNGGAGNDRMSGGLGNDTYIVTDAGDLIVDESVIGGVDLVRSTISFTLGSNLENLTLEGTAALNGTGNERNNTLTGNSAANVLEGLAGNDVMLGNGGNDILRGGLGNDTLQGGVGTDVMTGGEGADAFVFDMNASYNQAAMGKDIIRDFVAGVDRIVLDQTTFGPITRADIGLVATDRDAALSTNRIVYSEETSRLFFNANGAGRGFGNGGYFATLQGAPDLAVSDIAIQA